MDWKKITRPDRKLHNDPEVDELLKKLIAKGALPVMVVTLELDENGEPIDNSDMNVSCYGPPVWIASNFHTAIERHPEIRQALVTIAMSETMENLLTYVKKEQGKGSDELDLSKYDLDRTKPN